MSCGFFLGHSCAGSIFIPVIVTTGLLGCESWLLVHARRRHRRISVVWQAALGCALIAFALGWWRGHALVGDAARFAGAEVTASADVLSERGSGSAVWTLLHVRNVHADGASVACDFLVQATFSRPVTPVSPGDRLTVRGWITEDLRTQERAGHTPTAYDFVGQIAQVQHESDALLPRIRNEGIRVLQARTGMPPADATVLESLLFGVDTGLPKQTKDEFLAAGLLHVLAASGSNLVILEQAAALVMNPLWRWLAVPKFVRAAVHIGFAWVYAGMCDGQVSMVRAALMSSIQWLGFAVGRQVRTGATLLWSAVILVTAVPQTTLGVSGLLSFLATAAVHHAAHRRRSGQEQMQLPPTNAGMAYLAALTQTIGQTLSTTLWVELWLYPLLVLEFQQVTPYGLVSNLLAEPILAVLLPVSLYAAVLVNALPWTGGFVGWVSQEIGEVLQFGLQSFLGVVEAVSRLPLSILPVTVTPIVWLCLGGGWLVFLWPGRPRGRWRSMAKLGRFLAR